MKYQVRIVFLISKMIIWNPLEKCQFDKQYEIIVNSCNYYTTFTKIMQSVQNKILCNKRYWPNHITRYNVKSTIICRKIQNWH